MATGAARPYRGTPSPQLACIKVQHDFIMCLPANSFAWEGQPLSTVRCFLPSATLFSQNITC